MSDKNENQSDDYWEKYVDLGEGQYNHPISLDVSVKFKDDEGFERFAIREKDITCNPKNLKRFFLNLTKHIRMVHESLEEDDEEGL